MSFQDVRKSRKWMSAGEIRLLLFALFLLIALLAADVALARVLPGGEWFFMRWSGARAFLVEKIGPYSTEVAQRTQEVAYGRPAFSSEYGYVLNDPFYLVMLYSPLALIWDFTLARGLWMLFSQAALAGIVLFAFNLSEWQPPRWLYVFLLVFGLFGYFSLNALTSGTPAILLMFLYLWILTALRSGSDELAGVLLALIAYQWEVGGLFFLFILVFVFANRRWNVLVGFAMSLFVLLVVSFLAYPGWGLPYVRAVISDWNRGANLTFGRMLTTWFPDSEFPLGGIVAIVVGIVVFLEWLGSLGAHFRRVVWTASLSLAATPLVGLAIFPSNHTVLLLPFVLILALVWERWQRRRVWLSALILLLALAIPFGLYLRSVYIYDPLVNDLMAVLPPLAAIVGLYWMRWWILRPPRTWADRIGDQA
ncbi:MAG: DUF2029 domain-containing protein [Anaerolineales bacterium]|nr:DUF2029 domain-containing protein [Anaerolineales bacterium]